MGDVESVEGHGGEEERWAGYWAQVPCCDGGWES